MHYIPGVAFDVPETLRGQVDPKSLVRNRYIKMFPHSGRWELFHINRSPGGEIKYLFRSRDTYETHEVKFKSTSDGDRLISVMLGEELPNYEDVYINMSD